MIPFSFEYSFTRFLKEKIDSRDKNKKLVQSDMLYNIQNALYREKFVSDLNKDLVKKAKEQDYLYFIKYLANQDYKYQDLWSDEYFQNRIGMQKIFDAIKNEGSNKLRILDIGCENCQLLKELQKLGHDVYGVDLSVIRVLKNRKNFKNIEVSYCEDLPFEDDFFDIVIAQEVLEHVVDLRQTLSEIKRVLKNDGVTYIQVPYLNYVDCDNHLRLFSQETLNYWVNKYFKVLDMQLIPYCVGNGDNNIFLTAKKTDKTDVEFYLMDAFEIFQFLPLYNILRENNIDAKFVCEPCSINMAKSWFDYDTALSILKGKGLEYTEKANPYAKVSVTTQRVYYLEKYLNTKINIQYGAGLNRGNFCSTELATRGFDARLIYGEYTKEKIKSFISEENIYLVGIPKHDELLKNYPEKEDLKNELGIKTEKPILVYFPTWDEDSSISAFYEDLKKLKDNYFVITKAHHCTFRRPEKRQELDILYEISDIVLDGNYSFSNASVIADVALIDAKSGATTEVPFINSDIPILFLTVKENPREYFYHDIFEFGKLVTTKDNLCEELNKIFDNDPFIEKRRDSITYYMGERDGCSTQRALSAFLNIIKNIYI